MAIHNLDRTLNLLSHGALELHGQFVRGSNATLLVRVSNNKEKCWAVYKPRRGENPLWDFPDGSLAAREVAAFHISEFLGWHFVPPTVLRQDAPFGEGSLQQFFQYDPDVHYFTFDARIRALLDRVALFDLIINNADRKGSHLLLDADDRLWLIDHGLTFHHEPKLRTVIWEFAGEPIPPSLLADVQALVNTLTNCSDQMDILLNLITPREVDALLQRARQLLEEKLFPEPGERRVFPYPLI